MWKYLAGIPAAAFICSPKIVIHVNKLCRGKKNYISQLVFMYLCANSSVISLGIYQIYVTMHF